MLSLVQTVKRWVADVMGCLPLAMVTAHNKKKRSLEAFSIGVLNASWFHKTTPFQGIWMI